MSEPTLSKTPTADTAEDNAFFPSEYSLSQYVSSKTDFDGVRRAGAYSGTKKVLMIATDERYLLMHNGTMFSTGNHPVETLLPMHHISETGFDIDVATISGNPVKLELWAMPSEDAAVAKTYQRFLPRLKEPLKLSDVIDNGLEDSDYLGVFIPGGHGAMIGLPTSPEVQTVLDWALNNDKLIVTLCHGPAALLAAGLGREKSPLAGYSVCVFPNALDTGANIEIGYVPGHMRWLVATKLEEQGITVVNTEMSGQCHQDRKLITGDSPLASNQLGMMAADALMQAASTD